MLEALATAGCSAQKSDTHAGTASCNGAAGLCTRRLDEVVFPGTHNSFAASAEPGWYFANQTYGISRQLQDGIRALLIDVHYGVHDPATGRIRTDLGAEGSDANKVAEQVPARALRVADRVAGGVGLGTLHGTPEPYLCHTLCELGAEPLGRELEVIRSFLERNPDQVLVVIVEDYVPPATIEQAFGQAGLTRYVATLDRHASRLARGLAHVINIFDPEVVVLGGGLSRLEHFYRVLPPLVATHMFTDNGSVTIRPPRWGDASGVRGAARIWGLSE